MTDLTKVFVDLSKLSEEQVRMLNQVINIDINQISEFPLLFCFETEWDQAKKGDKFHIYGKTELTYPEFIKLFEGGEGEKDGWIKIESEADLPKEVGEYWAVWKDGEVGRKQFFCGVEKNIYSPNGNISEYDWWMRHITHYQPIIKPEPPKF